MNKRTEWIVTLKDEEEEVDEERAFITQSEVRTFVTDMLRDGWNLDAITVVKMEYRITAVGRESVTAASVLNW